MLIDLSLEDSNGEPPIRQPREGSNIHRNAEGKLLCSHSLKICNQKRMEGYGFCSKHILEDPAAPFKQCDNVNPKSNKQCTNPVSLSDPDPRYCVFHRQALGLTTPSVSAKKGKKPPQSSPLHLVSAAVSHVPPTVMTLDDVPPEPVVPERHEPSPEHVASRRRLDQVLREVGVRESVRAEHHAESDSSSVASEDDDEEVEAITAQNNEVDFMNGVIYFERADPEPVTALSEGTQDVTQRQFNLIEDYLSTVNAMTEKEFVTRRKIHLSNLVQQYKQQYRKLKHMLSANMMQYRTDREHYLASYYQQHPERVALRNARRDVAVRKRKRTDQDEEDTPHKRRHLTTDLSERSDLSHDATLSSVRHVSHELSNVAPQSPVASDTQQNSSNVIPVTPVIMARPSIRIKIKAPTAASDAKNSSPNTTTSTQQPSVNMNNSNNNNNNNNTNNNNIIGATDLSSTVNNTLTSVLNASTVNSTTQPTDTTPNTNTVSNQRATVEVSATTSLLSNATLSTMTMAPSDSSDSSSDSSDSEHPLDASVPHTES
jgi:hypothetical protein